MNNRFSDGGKPGKCSLADTVSEAGHSHATSSPKARDILLIDDNPEVARAVEIAFRLAGHVVHRAEKAEEAYSMLARRRFDAIILDLNFSPGKTDGKEGLACLKRIIGDDSTACIVVLTAHGGVRTAVTAMQSGARDFAVKPWSNADLIAKVEAAIARDPVALSTVSTSPQSATAPSQMLGESAVMADLRDLIQRIGPTPAGVAITGLAGSGRTLAALALHAASAHAGTRPLPIDLREDAEWDDLSTATGTVILRHVERLDEKAQDRLRCALPAEVRTFTIADNLGDIGPALLRRIAVIEIAVPTLAERGDDVLLLARHFLRVAADRFERALPSLSDAALEIIRMAHWPDEARGLALAMERAVLLAQGDEIGPQALAFAAPAGNPVATQVSNQREHNFDLERTEKTLIEAALREHGHNISHTARALGLSRAALYRRMERHGL